MVTSRQSNTTQLTAAEIPGTHKLPKVQQRIIPCKGQQSDKVIQKVSTNKAGMQGETQSDHVNAELRTEADTVAVFEIAPYHRCSALYSVLAIL